MDRRISRRVALCGVLGALMVGLMLLGTLFPLSTYACPGLAGALLIPVLFELGGRSGVLLYCAVSVLSMILAPSKESALFFVLLLGWYPIARTRLQHIQLRPLRIVLKLIVFNAATCAVYALLLFVLVSPELTAEAAGWTAAFLIGFLALGNATFLVYDLCLGRIGDWYVCRLRPKLFPAHR